MMTKPEAPALDDRELLRRQLLLLAEAALATEGADKLSLRQLARAAGISTMGIYTAFGSKDGLMQALYAEGFKRLYRHAASAAQRGDPARWLWDALWAYRRFALANTGLYRLCFGGEQRFVPVDRDTRFGTLTVPDQGAYPSYNSLMGAFAEGQRQGVITAQQSADALAHLAWAIIHGLVSLEIAGYVDPASAETRFRDSTEMFLRAVITDPAAVERVTGAG
jgi:AcrR family transcriptional regulator